MTGRRGIPRDITPKERTRRATAALVRRGELTPTACARCGSSAVETHHTSYDDPRAVEFLCRPCHGRAHSRPAPAHDTGDPGLDRVRRALAAAIGTRTQAEMAPLLGVTQPTLSRFLQGVHMPGLAFFAAAARAFPGVRAALVAVLFPPDSIDEEVI